MSDRGSSDGIGCVGVLLVLAMVAWVLQHIVAIIVLTLIVGLLVGLVAGGGKMAMAAAERAQERARCPVCRNWTPSVLLTDLDPAKLAALCGPHRTRLQRITALEREAFGDA